MFYVRQSPEQVRIALAEIHADPEFIEWVGGGVGDAVDDDREFETDEAARWAEWGDHHYFT
jgi:hypothetical protein